MRLITGAVKEINRLGKLGLFQTHMQDLHLIWGIRGGNAKNKNSGRNSKPMEIRTFIIPWQITNTLAYKIRIDDAGQNERPRREPS
jgi:hypothetical protein